MRKIKQKMKDKKGETFRLKSLSFSRPNVIPDWFLDQLSIRQNGLRRNVVHHSVSRPRPFSKVSWSMSYSKFEDHIYEYVSVPYFHVSWSDSKSISLIYPNQ